MEKIVKLGLLYDFYGELLTKHQQEVYEDFVYNDLSVSEIADAYSISRQASSDLIKRINSILNNYEDKLKLCEKFENVKAKINAIEELSDWQKEEILKEF